MRRTVEHSERTEAVLGHDPLLRRLHTEKQEAARLRVSTRTLQAWRYRGGGPPYLKLGSGSWGAIRYDPADVDAWLEECTRTSTSDPGPETER
jgi:hypothetical protein